MDGVSMSATLTRAQQNMLDATVALPLGFVVRGAARRTADTLSRAGLAYVTDHGSFYFVKAVQSASVSTACPSFIVSALGARVGNHTS